MLPAAVLPNSPPFPSCPIMFIYSHFLLTISLLTDRHLDDNVAVWRSLDRDHSPQIVNVGKGMTPSSSSKWAFIFWPFPPPGVFTFVLSLILVLVLAFAPLPSLLPLPLFLPLPHSCPHPHSRLRPCALVLVLIFVFAFAPATSFLFLSSPLPSCLPLPPPSHLCHPCPLPCRPHSLHIPCSHQPHSWCTEALQGAPTGDRCQKAINPKAVDAASGAAIHHDAFYRLRINGPFVAAAHGAIKGQLDHQGKRWLICMGKSFFFLLFKRHIRWTDPFATCPRQRGLVPSTHICLLRSAKYMLKNRGLPKNENVPECSTSKEY